MTLVPFGSPKHSYILGGANFSVSTTVHKATVPAGKIWFVTGGLAYRDVSSTVVVEAYDASDQIIGSYGSAGASTGNFAFPYMTVSIDSWNPAFVALGAGGYIKFTFGTAQTANAKCSVNAIEVPA